MLLFWFFSALVTKLGFYTRITTDMRIRKIGYSKVTAQHILQEQRKFQRYVPPCMPYMDKGKGHYDRQVSRQIFTVSSFRGKFVKKMGGVRLRIDSGTQRHPRRTKEMKNYPGHSADILIRSKLPHKICLN